MNKLSHYFINGLIVLVPIVITYFVIATVFAIVEGIVESYIPLKIPGSGEIGRASCRERVFRAV